MSRGAAGDGRLVFVLRDVGAPTNEMQRFIKERFPFAKTVILEELTAGAPFSSAAGVALTAHLVTLLVFHADGRGSLLNFLGNTHMWMPSSPIFPLKIPSLAISGSVVSVSLKHAKKR